MKTAALWTGGKDSALACNKAMREHDVVNIVTFIWDKPSLAHPLSIIKSQSEAIEIPFLWYRLKPPYKESYREAILHLKQNYRIDSVVTGDISYVDAYHGNWIDEVCKDTGVEVIKPLWEHDRQSILDELLDNGFRILFSCVKEPWMTEEWLGRILDSNSMKEMQTLHQLKGSDLCGENGEYHTMVLDAPYFTKTIQVPQFQKEKTPNGFIMKELEVLLKSK